jgi:hypothetical protein
VLEAKVQASNAQVAEHSFITPQSANEVMNAMARATGSAVNRT